MDSMEYGGRHSRAGGAGRAPASSVTRRLGQSSLATLDMDERVASLSEDLLVAGVARPPDAHRVPRSKASVADVAVEAATEASVLRYQDKVVLRADAGLCVSITKTDGAALAAQRERERQEQAEAKAKAKSKSKSRGLASVLGAKDMNRPRRASFGSAMPVEVPKPAYTVRLNGNPTEALCGFSVVNADRRRAAVSHGDRVVLLHEQHERMLAVGLRDDADGASMGALYPGLDVAELEIEEQYVVATRRPPKERVDKRTGKHARKLQARSAKELERALWTLVEVPSDTVERRREREGERGGAGGGAGERRGDAGSARLVRSSDSVMLRSVWADDLFLMGEAGQLFMCRAPPAGRGRQCHFSLVKSPAAYVPTWARSRDALNKFGSGSGSLGGGGGGGGSGSGGGGAGAGAGLGGDPRARAKARVELQDLPAGAQEARLVDSLLYAMQGVESELVTCDGRSGEWRVEPGVLGDRALEQLAQRMTGMCADYVAAKQFVVARRRLEFGRVAHALSAAMHALLREFDVLLVQLEQQLRAGGGSHSSHSFSHSSHSYAREGQQGQQGQGATGGLSLQKLWFYVQPSMRALRLLAKVAVAAAERTGGALLNAVRALGCREGDAKLRAVYQFLVQKATAPYLEMLERWVYHGVIRDPFGEFMVMVAQDISSKDLSTAYHSNYWDLRYALRGSGTLGGGGFGTGGAPAGAPGSPSSSSKKKQDTSVSVSDTSVSDTPWFLARQADAILTTGKYLNVVRECGRWVANPCAAAIPFSDESHSYHRTIAEAHAFASKTLLALLLGEQDLLGRLRSLKHHFLLDQGDYLVHFMDLAEKELAKDVGRVSVTRLQALLEMSVRVRNSNDPYHEDLTCELHKDSLARQMEDVLKLKESQDRARRRARGGASASASASVSASASASVSASGGSGRGSGSGSGRDRDRDRDGRPDLAGGLDSSFDTANASLDVSFDASTVSGADADWEYREREEERERDRERELERALVVGGPTATGFEHLTLRYSVQWPLSLVLSLTEVTKYEMVFRLLFLCKRVERKLCAAWQVGQLSKELDVRALMGRELCVRQRMLHFWQNFQYYVFFEVLEPKWHDMERKLESVATVDELMSVHANFLDGCLQEALLMHAGLLEALHGMARTCELLSDIVAASTQRKDLDEDSMRRAGTDGNVYRDREGGQRQRQRPLKGGAAGTGGTGGTGAGAESKGREVARSGAGAAGGAAGTIGGKGAGEASNQARLMRKARHKTLEDQLRREIALRSRAVADHERAFDEAFDKFTELLTASEGEKNSKNFVSSHSTNLVQRLDFNSYYAKRAARAAALQP